MRSWTIILTALGFFFFVGLFSVAHPKVGEIKFGKGEGPVEIEADQLIYDRETQIYEAHGHVKVTRGDLSLVADHAQLNMATKDVKAWGNVTMREGEDVLECDRLEVNLETRLGKVYQAKFFLKEQNFHITGEEAEKFGENLYRIRKGSFTTCDAARPPWKFTAEELEVTLGGYAVAKSPVFYIEDVPVLYSPRGYFPVKKERETGFLLPNVGYSSQNGFEVKTAFFWAMAKNMDSTVYLDYWGNRGFMEGLEYRYALKRDTYGEARFHFIKDKEYDGKRYAFFVQHEQKLPQDFYLKGDINYVSDNTFPQDFPDYLPATTKIDARSLQQVRSVVFGGKNWDRFSLLANAEYFEILSRENNKITVQKLPQVSLYGYPQTLLNTPLFYDFAVSYTNFWRREGVEAQRWDFLPELLLPMRVFNVLKVEPNVGFRETLYLPYNDPTGVFNKWESRETFETGLRMSTEFYRVYEGSRENKILKAFNVGKWMHTIEPTVSYTYIPRVNQDKIPFFDEVDRISYTNAVTYGFITRLLGKPWQETREHRPQEFFKFQVTQSYSFGDPFSLDEEGKRRDFSNIQGQLWANFSPYVNARADVEFNPYDINFPRVNGLISVRDRRNDAILFEYLETKDQIKQANVFARIKVVEGFHVYGGIRYNLLYNTAVENDYGAEYQAQCWTLGVLVQDIKPSPDGSVKGEWKFQFYLNLLNLGAVGHKAVMMQF